MAIYDIDDMSYLTQDVYTRLRKAPVQSQRERDTMKNIHVDRRFYDFVDGGEWTAQGYKKLEDVSSEGEGNVLVAVYLTLRAGDDIETKEAELAKWYREEHVPLLQKVPGWRRTRRFVTSHLDLAEGREKVYLSLHEYAPSNGLGGPEFKAATSTSWNDKIYAEVVDSKKRRVYNLYYTFGPAPRDLTSLTSSSTIPASSTDALTKTTPASPPSTPYPIIESFITTPDGVQLPYHLSGSPDPAAPLLILINSILTSHEIWADFSTAFLAQTNNKYRILRYNARGRSTLPASSTSPVTVNTLAADVIAIMDALRVKTASLVGVSLGGATALNTALKYPSRVAAFVACDTNSVAPAGNPKAWGERIAVAEKDGATLALSQGGEEEPIVGPTLAELTTRRWFPETSYASASLAPKIEAVNEMVRTNSLAGFKDGVKALYEYDFRDEMKKFGGKGAFLVGAQDGVLPKTMKDMAEGLGKDGTTVLKVVEGAGHLPMVDRAEEVAGFVAGFLEG